MKRNITALLISFSITLIFGLFLVSRVDQRILGARSIKLIPACELIYFDTRLQPVNTLVLACPHMDMIRFWPLPIQRPWFEHPDYDKPDGIKIY